MNILPQTPISPQDDILIYSFGGFSSFMMKDRELWIRLGDIWYFLTDSQRMFLLRDGVGLCNMPSNPLADGEYVKYDSFILCASLQAKPILREIKKSILSMIAHEGGKHGN